MFDRVIRHLNPHLTSLLRRACPKTRRGLCSAGGFSKFESFSSFARAWICLYDSYESAACSEVNLT